LFDNPLRRADRSLGKIVPALRAVDKFQSLPDAPEDHRVLAHNVPGPDRLNADLSFGPLSDHAAALIHRFFIQITPQPAGNHPRHLHGRSAGRVLFQMMMRLDDFDIVIFIKNAGAVFQHLQHHIDAHAHVRRQYAACFFGKPSRGCHFFGGEARGADHDGAVFFAGDLQIGQRGFMVRKVDHDVGLIDAVGQTVADQRAGSPRPQRMPQISSDNRMALDLDGPDNAKFFHGRNHADDPASHFPAGACYNYLYHTACSFFHSCNFE